MARRWWLFDRLLNRLFSPLSNRGDGNWSWTGVGLGGSDGRREVTRRFSSEVFGTNEVSFLRSRGFEWVFAIGAETPAQADKLYEDDREDEAQVERRFAGIS